MIELTVKQIESGLGKKKIGSIACIAIIVISLVFNGWFYIQVNNLKTEKENLQEEYATLSAHNQTLSEELNASYRVKQSEHFTITYPYGFDDYAEAILKICEYAYWGYEVIYGLSLPLPIRIPIYMLSSEEGETPMMKSGNYSKPLLCTEHYQIYWEGEDDLEDDLLPPTMGGPHYVSGFCHEIAKIFFMFDDWLFSMGWAIYAPAFRIVPFIYRYAGEEIWPQPYNYSKTEGPNSLLSIIENQTLCQPNSYYAAAKILYQIDQKYSAELIGEAINTLKENHTPSGYSSNKYPTYSLTAFREILVELTDDPTILDLFSEYGF